MGASPRRNRPAQRSRIRRTLWWIETIYPLAQSTMEGKSVKKKTSHPIVPLDTIDRRICIIRDQRVILDRDLAELYDVPTKRFNEQVKRNLTRFPGDFMFQLTQSEKDEVVAKCDHLHVLKFSHALPYAFTEYGALQAANVLNSERAVRMSVYVIRAFVRLREVFVMNQILEERLSEIEKMLLNHDRVLSDLYQKIRELLSPPKQTRAIGFRVE